MAGSRVRGYCSPRVNVPGRGFVGVDVDDNLYAFVESDPIAARCLGNDRSNTLDRH